MAKSTPRINQKKSGNQPKPFQFVLPAKITGVVFWGLVLIGFTIAVFMLQGKEQSLKQQYNTDSDLLAHSLESILSKNTAFSDIKIFINKEFSHYQEQFRFNAFTLKQGDTVFQFGAFEANDTRYTQSIIVNTGQDTSIEYELNIFYPNINDVVVAERKDMLLSIGALVFLFGLILQKTLQYILTNPFLKLLNSAQQFARGDTAARFDESTSDEFGFLSKFINEALDSIEQQQREVHRALARAKKSELALYKEKELAEVTLHSITDAVITTNAQTRINFMNPVAERLLGLLKEETRGKLIAEIFQLVDEDSRKTIENPLVQLLENQSIEPVIKDTALRRHNGELLSIELSVAPMRNETNEVIGGVVVFQDVSEARRMTSQLSFQAKHDELTGLFNRRVFEQKLQEMLEDARYHENEHVLCYLDLDQFKVVNDTCGHIAGDELLRQLSTELSGSIRETDLLARLGGDEFGILLENCELKQAENLANTLRENVKNYRFIWDARIFEIGVSIGVVAINKDSEKISDIMSAADLACYAAKDSGRNRIHVYQPTDAELAKRHSEMYCVTRINHALEDDSFIIYKQPIVSIDVNEGDPMHWEILVRMENMQGEQVAPEGFISAAERFNLMPKIDRMVIKKTFQAMSSGCFFHDGYKGRVVGINLSGDSLTDETFLSYIKDQANRFQIDFNEVCLEITETVAIANLAQAMHFVTELKKLGCQFALDDFGSGLSSFGYLKNLPVDYLKIDGSFIIDMSSDKIDCALVESINQVGHIMEMKTIAEWVEDEKTFNMLKELGVDFSQGYYTGSPEPL